MHSYRVGGSLSKSLAGTAGDEVVNVGGWKTESIAKYYIATKSSGRVHGSKRKCSRSCPSAGELLLSFEFEKRFGVCA